MVRHRLPRSRQRPKPCYSAAVTISTPDALWASQTLATSSRRPWLPAACGAGCAGAQLLDGVDLPSRWARGSPRRNPAASASLLLRVLAGVSPRMGARCSLAGLDLVRHLPGRLGTAGRVPGPATGRFPVDVGARSAPAGRAAPRPRTRADARRADRRGRGAWGLAAGRDRPCRGRAGFMQTPAIAAALVGDPEIILLDEPLRALDPMNGLRLLRLPGEPANRVLASRYPASEAGLVDQVAFVQRAAWSSRPDRRSAGRLPLSMEHRDLAGMLAVRGRPLAAMRSRPSQQQGRAARWLPSTLALSLRELWISFRLLLLCWPAG